MIAAESSCLWKEGHHSCDELLQKGLESGIWNPKSGIRNLESSIRTWNKVNWLILICKRKRNDTETIKLTLGLIRHKQFTSTSIRLKVSFNECLGFFHFHFVSQISVRLWLKFLYHIPDSRFRVLCSRFPVPGSRFPVPGFRQTHCKRSICLNHVLLKHSGAGNICRQPLILPVDAVGSTLFCIVVQLANECSQIFANQYRILWVTASSWYGNFVPNSWYKKWITSYIHTIFVWYRTRKKSFAGIM